MARLTGISLPPQVWFRLATKSQFQLWSEAGTAPKEPVPVFIAALHPKMLAPLHDGKSETRSLRIGSTLSSTLPSRNATVSLGNRQVFSFCDSGDLYGQVFPSV